MTSRSGGPATGIEVSVERAQLVWLRAVDLADPARDTDRFLTMLDLLRTANHGPSTMQHALALGRTNLRATPDDAATQQGVRLLARTIGWLGKRVDDGEIGTLARPNVPI